MATTADIKKGLCINYNGKPFTIVDFQHVKPGKGPAFVRTKLKNLETGKLIDNTFTSGFKIDVIRVERRKYQYLYEDDLGMNFMHTETFEQIPLSKALMDNPLLLKEGMEVEVLFNADNETPLQLDLPPFIEMEVVYTEPGIKGDTSSSTALKPAKLDTGLEVMVPLFINEGDWIKVDTRDASYSERVKK
ncbi:MAG: elongation factor P [Bacteroidales bacterium]|nr:elongation factor P [Bacteroidales bacterium]